MKWQRVSEDPQGYVPIHSTAGRCQRHPSRPNNG